MTTLPQSAWTTLRTGLPGEDRSTGGRRETRSGSRESSSEGVVIETLEGLSGQTELRTHAHGFRQVWPRPTEEALRTFYSETFYDSHSPTYLEQVSQDRVFWDATWSLRRSMMEAALPPSRRRLLDVGASGGFLLDHFREHGWEVHGIEPSRRAVAWAKTHHQLDLFCGELLDYPVRPPNASFEPEPDPAVSDSRFDAIHCAQVLEHVLDPVACIERIASLLAPGGVAFIELPNDFNSFQEAARKELKKPAWWVAPKVHLNYFDAESLSAVLAASGLVEEDRLASFPMELFLLMGEDYIGHPDVGSACHAKRMRFEKTLFENGHSETLLKFYRALAKASLGRTIGILARKAS